MPGQGDFVLYVCEFDADTSVSPNVAPALVTKVNANGSLDLNVFFLNGMFMKQNVSQDDGSKKRETWFPKP